MDRTKLLNTDVMGNHGVRLHPAVTGIKFRVKSVATRTLIFYEILIFVNLTLFLNSPNKNISPPYTKIKLCFCFSDLENSDQRKRI